MLVCKGIDLCDILENNNANNDTMYDIGRKNNKTEYLKFYPEITINLTISN